MPRRLDPRQIIKLAQVQHVRKAVAEAALVFARDAERLALESRERAERDVTEAQDDWFGHLAGSRFEPERARDLAERMVRREDAVQVAAIAHDESCDLHARRQADWRLGSARVELADAMLKAARRAKAQAREERRLAELSDRITYDWMER